MTSSPLNNFWVEFIELYKSLPELWCKDTDEYTNKTMRAKAYNVLVEKYKEVDRDANVYAVKKKINNLRTCFRREVNKVRKSEMTALNQSDIYTPTLWYYPHLEFLIDEEEEMSGPTTIEAVEQVDVDDGREYSTPQPKRKKFSTQLPEETTHTKTDKAKTLSASWEVQYRDLDVRQKLFANRIINEVLYQGALGRLHENSYKILEMAVVDTNRENHYSPESGSESQYFLTESTENENEKYMKHEKRERRSKHSK